MIVAGDADGLVVYKLDRLTRSMRDFCELVDWFEEAERALVMLEPDVDTSTPAGRAVAHVMTAFAEMERGLIAERTRAALAAKRARGETARGAARWRASSVQSAAGWRRRPPRRRHPALPVIDRRRRAA
jgi:DNA invertase Pin-like site-specific DNA recombinase